MYKLLKYVAVNLAIIITLDTAERAWLKWKRR